ncbi:heparinase II/III domain-containing protein [Parafrigoribacterium soli]|uniref:heparinase II/III domain-containing protein n=1 Tax=Parafrigoribacterium soli TaxID=3144663 RepID=UPI0032EF4C44
MGQVHPFRGPLFELFARHAAPDRPIEALTDLLRAAVLPPDRALPVAPAVDRTLWDGVDRATVESLIARAAADVGTAWPQPLASAAARVHRDGDRLAWEDPAFARQRRLSRAAVAALATLEDRWVDEVADGAWLLCEQTSWCWPAHDDSMREHDSVLATVTDPFLDLGAGEVVAQLAWIDHLLGSQLDDRYPGLRTRIRHEARTRVFGPFVERRNWHWLGLDGDVHNWNPWIHGNVLVAALRLLDQPEEREERLHVIALTIEGLDRYVASLPDDGAIDEGYAYWWNGACRALEALDLLRFATAGALDAVPSIEALRNTVAFPHRMHLGGDWYLNLADGQAKPSSDQPWHALHRAAVRVGDSEAKAHAATHRITGGAAATEATGLGRLLIGMTDAAWLTASAASSPLPREVWLGSTQVLIARERGGSTLGLTLAAKAGNNGEHHNHNDVGSFVVASDGIPVLIDAGRPTYTATTFGPDRYTIWTMQSSWHSVPDIRGIAQSAGKEYAASNVQAALSPSSASLGLDLEGAYDVPGLGRWRRELRLDRDDAPDGAGTIVIADSWDLEPGSAAGESTTIRLLVAGRVALAAGTAVITPLEGAPPLRLRWPEDVGAATTVRALDDPMLSEVWGSTLTRIDLDVTARDKLSVTVEVATGSGRGDR